MMTWSSIFFQSPSNSLMEFLISMHDYSMMFLFSILVMIFLSLMSLMFMKNFNLSFYEDHQLETTWTVVPFILLVFMIIPSLNSLFMLDSCLFCGLTINIMGHQWYWSYFYKDLAKNFFDSYMVSSDSSMIRLLEVDNRLIVPTFIPLRFILSSSDVIHSWTIPSMGVKMDAIPGRLNQFCFSTKRSGIYFGQCSEICGSNHSFMPIVMESVSFKDWIKLFLTQ